MMGGYIVTVVSVQVGGTHLHQIILPLVPCPFQVPQWLIPDPFWGVPQSQAGATTGCCTPPGSSQDGVSPVRSGWGTPSQVNFPQPGQDGVPPPPQSRLCLDGLCLGRYASYGFPHEDCLVLFKMERRNGAWSWCELKYNQEQLTVWFNGCGRWEMRGVSAFAPNFWQNSFDQIHQVKTLVGRGRKLKINFVYFPLEI